MSDAQGAIPTTVLHGGTPVTLALGKPELQDSSSHQSGLQSMILPQNKTKTETFSND